MRGRLQEYQEETGHIYNLEATPAEGTSYRLAMADKKKFPEIAASGNGVPYYTNSTQLPVGFTNDLFKAMSHQESLQRKYTGGTVFHMFLGESLNGGDEAAKLVKKVTGGFKMPYYTLTPTFSVCPAHGYIRGEHFKCPACNKTAEVYSRVVGYLRPVQDWNKGKQKEFGERKTFAV